MNEMTKAVRPEFLPALLTGTAGQVEVLLWIAVAACTFGAALFALGDSSAAVQPVAISAAFWSMLTVARAARAFGLGAGSRQWPRNASDHESLAALEDLQLWTLFLLIAATGVLVPWRPLPFIVWVFKAATALLAVQCGRAVIRSVIRASAGRYFDAVLTASPGPQGAAIQVDIVRIGRTGAALHEATFEVVEVTLDLDQDSGMNGRVVQAASARASDSGEAGSRFEFALPDETVFRVATQGRGVWVFSAVSQTRPIFVRLRVSGPDCALAFAWR